MATVSRYILSSHLVYWLRLIFESGHLSEFLMDGITIHVFRKVDEYDVNNFRGLSFVGCISKLFATIIINRLADACESHQMVFYAQFVFRTGFSLRLLIDHFMINSKRLYCAFVDMKKCFD